MAWDLQPLLSIFAGLGFCYVGTAILSINLKKLSGSSLHRVITRGVSNQFLAAFWGIIVNAIVNKASAAASIFASLLSSDMLDWRKAVTMLVWGNLGSVALLYLITIKTDPLILLSIGISGLWFAFQKVGHQKYLGRGLFGIALLLFGMYFMRKNTSGEGAVYLHEFFENFRSTPGYLILLIGFISEFVIQSGTIGAIILMQLMNEEVINIHQAALFLLGARLMSGMMVVFNNINFAGQPLQLICCQSCFNIITSTSCVILIIIEYYTGIPLILKLITNSTQSTTFQIINLYNYYNVLGVILMTCFNGVITQFIGKYVKSPHEDPTKPQFLLNVSREDPMSCLSQAYKEQLRVMEEIYAYIGYIRTTSEGHATHPAYEPDIIIALNKKINSFLVNLQGELHDRVLFMRWINLLNLNSSVSYITQTLYQFRVILYDDLGNPNSQLNSIYSLMIETFDLIIATTLDTMKTLKKNDIDILIILTKDRSSVLKKLETYYFTDQIKNKEENRENSINAIELFSRFIWLANEITNCLEKERDKLTPSDSP